MQSGALLLENTGKQKYVKIILFYRVCLLLARLVSVFEG